MPSEYFQQLIVTTGFHYMKISRFYPTTSPFADRNGNTRPGTVVDKGVTDV